MSQEIELRTYTVIDSLQPQTAAFVATVAGGYLPLEKQSALLVEVAPGMSINRVTDTVLKSTDVTPGMLIVERAFGMLEVHSADKGQIEAAGGAILDFYGIAVEDRLKPKITNAQIITGIAGHHAMIINRMRHGDMIAEGDALYLLEVHPAGYALLAANEAEKHATIKVLEFQSFGAFGRVWLGGDEENIAEADKAVKAVLGALAGRAND